MIVGFPKLYPHELLYSGIARFLDVTSSSSRRRNSDFIFGSADATAVIDLPARIDEFVCRIAGSSLFTSDFIRDHTLYPFYAAFLSPERQHRLERGMSKNGGRSTHLVSGIMSSRVSAPPVLRQCSVCRDEARHQIGENYWNRLHQIPGIDVCSLHELWLENTDVRRTHRQDRRQFATAEATESIPLHRPRSETDRLVHSRLAKAAKWIIEHRPHYGPCDIQDVILTRLRERGLLTSQGNLRHEKIRSDFIDQYGETLRSLRSEVSETYADDWLSRILRGKRGGQAPVRQLLVWDFLKLSHDEIATGRTTRHRSETCVNVVCGFAGNPTCDRTSKSRPTYACNWCGLTFTKTADGALRIISRGPIWESELCKLWKARSLSLREISRRLAADPLTVKRCAHDLGLAFPRHGKRKSHALDLRQRHVSRRQPSVAHHRRRWLKQLRRHRWITSARKSDPVVYAYLYRNDREWLRSVNSGRERKPSPKGLVAPWGKRDQMLFTILTESNSAANDSDIRQTPSGIARGLKASAWLAKHPEKFPKTISRIDSLTETRIEFALRRIAKTADRVGAPQKRWVMVRQAGLREDLQSHPEIAVALSRVSTW